GRACGSPSTASCTSPIGPSSWWRWAASSWRSSVSRWAAISSPSGWSAWIICPASLRSHRLGSSPLVCSSAARAWWVSTWQKSSAKCRTGRFTSSGRNMSKTHESAVVTYSSDESVDARMQIFGLLNSYPASDAEKERSLGLFLRGSLLARILAIADIYKLIVDVPGTVFDVGTWRGQTAVLCENLRAIFEPLHFNRRIVCFDTFEGYKGFSGKDKATKLHRDGTYALSGNDYAEFLRQLLVLHEKSNAMGHNHGKHTVIK